MSDTQKSLAHKYLYYRLFTNMWFVGAIWLFFYRIFINDQQVGILDGLSFGIGLIAEVPSGALADRYGRDRIVKLGLILAGLGILIQAFGSSFLPFFIGQSILMIGIAFTSGADEALFFDKLKFENESIGWRNLVARGSQFSLIGGLVATLLGGGMYSFNTRLPWILTGLSFLFTVVIVWSVKEERTVRTSVNISQRVSEYLEDIKEGFKLFMTNEIRLYAPLIITVQGLFYTTGWGLLRLVLLDRFHFDAIGSSIVITVSRIVTIGLLALLYRYAHKISEKSAFSVITLTALLSLMVSLADIGYWGALVIITLYAGEHVMHPFISEILNKNVDDKRRATLLSVASFLRTLPYVILAPVIGFLNTVGQLHVFLVGWSILIMLALYLYLVQRKKDALLEVTKDMLS